MDKPIEWIGSTLEDLQGFPEEVKYVVGHALREAQQGKKSDAAKPMKGYQGASVLEIVDDFDKNTYRAVYTVKFKKAVYVIHCFQKKSKKGIETAKQDIDTINSRLKRALEHYEENYGKD